MRSAIIYYSYSGNTRAVAETLAECLRQKGEAASIELKSLDEPGSFFGQCRRAIVHLKAKIAPVDIDLSGYDLVCFGTPVWAFGPAPAMNAYLADCSGIKGKPVILFTTYGSGTGNERCLRYMENVLTGKGAKEFRKFSVQQGKTKDKRFIISKINQTKALL